MPQNAHDHYLRMDEEMRTNMSHMVNIGEWPQKTDHQKNNLTTIENGCCKEYTSHIIMWTTIENGGI